MPQQLQQFLNANFPALFVAAVLIAFGNIAFMLWRRKIRGPHFPNRSEVNILFEERWTSGSSHKSLFTRFGGASNCLRVAITDDELWMALHFPFIAFSARLDLDHRICRNTITNIEQHGKLVRVTFTLDDGDARMIALRLRNDDQFVAVLRSDAASGGNAE